MNKWEECRMKAIGNRLVRKMLGSGFACLAGAWRGGVEYMIDHTTVQGAVNLVTAPIFEPGHGKNVTVRNLLRP